jgi:hypothetical protein
MTPVPPEGTTRVSITSHCRETAREITYTRNKGSSYIGFESGRVACSRLFQEELFVAPFLSVSLSAHLGWTSTMPEH